MKINYGINRKKKGSKSYEHKNFSLEIVEEKDSTEILKIIKERHPGWMATGFAYTNRTVFKEYPAVSHELPMLESDFWHWLEKQEGNTEESFVSSLKSYLGQFGFDISKHIITSEDVHTFRLIYTHFWWCLLHK